MDVEMVSNKEPGKPITIRSVFNDKFWLLAVAVCVAALIAVYQGTFGWWWRIYMEDESYYSHGILIPFMSAFVIYINRKKLAEVELKPSLWGLAIVIPAVVIEVLAHAANTASTMGLTLPLLLVGAVLFLFGPKMTRQLLFPILFLFFMCVLPGFVLTKLSFKIQLLSTTIATHLLNIMQFDAAQSGTQITLPSINVLVGAPCSGFRMLISLMAFAVFFAYMKEGPSWGRLTLVASTVPLSFLANSIRVAMIAIAGEWFGEDVMHSFHDYSGFIVLAVSFVVLWWLAKVVKCEKFRSMLLS